ncbi:PLP-dependent transferase [Rickenella mellea]|uniref:PLP-dependent transferase n=1 Tax=Rickenella mellea TaxID=50990 RepID=A0A4Y7PN93_9AGAM|nr:PLP-dependent transferase [Rickenella mellea]
MGNSHSRSNRARSPAVKRAQSSTSRLLRKLSCISASSLDGLSDVTTEIDEKGTIRERDRLTAVTPPGIDPDIEMDNAYSDFIDAYPEYQNTWIVDSLRRSEFTRLAHSGETYVDYMGGSLYPESLVRSHSDFLTRSVMGNTHSVSNSSRLSATRVAEARNAVLRYFKAPADYTVIFTSNATAALKLVGESYPFSPGGSYVLGVDSHNSLNGIRKFASDGGARIRYLRSGRHGGFDEAEVKSVLSDHSPSDCSPCLFGLTGLSNISNSKYPLSLSAYAQSLGYHTILDAAALAATSPISLEDNPVDAMAISFYKMFGFPTGVGALVVKESFLKVLKRPWFSGGTVDVVQVPGSLVTMTHDSHEQFEDGTINYLVLPAITQGIRFLSTYMPFLPVRLSALLRYLTSQLEQLRHDVNGAPVVRILSQRSMRRVKEFGDQSDTGFTISMIFLAPDGTMISNSFVEYTASQQKISLRTGCVCNPGGAAVILGIEEDMNLLYPGVTLKDFERRVGRELGVVRISLGLVSSFADVYKVMQFASAFASGRTRMELWKVWDEARSRHHGRH